MGRGSALFGDVPGRITGTTAIAANYAGAVLLITVLVTAGLALQATARRDRALAWAAVAVQMVALGLTFSRAPLALALAGLVALIILRSRAILLVPMVLAVGAAILLSPLRERFLADSTNRLALWWSAFLIMIDHPLTGSGPGLSRVVARANPERYVFTELGRAPATAHNAILHGGAEMGVLGLLGFLLTYVLLAIVGLLATVRAIRAGDTLALALALALGGFLAQGMVNNLMTVGMTSVLGGLLAGTVASGVLSDAVAPAAAPSRDAGRRAGVGRTALHSRP
jgi:O-antigen ligase